jgi:hypothetical protein
MTPDEYLDLKRMVIDHGYAREIDWADGLTFPKDSETLCLETIHVICNSGMKYEIAQKIYEKILKAITKGVDIRTVFKNKNKVRAIKLALFDRQIRYGMLHGMKDDLEKALVWFEKLDGIGKVTKYHLARNCGFDVCKPDRHLVRIAQSYGMTPEQMCQALSDKLGDRMGVVDVVIWRAAVEGWI